MPINKCRICSHNFFKRPLLRYRNMPKAAQYLPCKSTVKSDKGINLAVRQCSGCGLVQLNSGPVPYYREVIRAAAFSKEMKDFRIKQFGNLVQKYSLKGKKVIEIGCGRGEYLSLMRKLGVKAYGLEYSKESVKQCRKEGLNVSRGFVQGSAGKLNHAPFDAFFILNFLEHLPDPNSTLSGIYNNLTDEAIGLVEVPNFDMILRNKLFSEFAADHLFYFTQETLTTALSQNGFEVVDCNEVWYNYIISAVVKKRKKTDLSPFCKHQEQIKRQIEQYTRCFKDKNIAVWGAGHQALAAISLLNLAGKIKYIVDSAVFKQGKYTPATHIPIFSPQLLEKDPVDAVIVMAGSYGAEVARIVRQKFGKSIKVAVLRDYGLEVV